jgi:hypothetical protein
VLQVSRRVRGLESEVLQTVRGVPFKVLSVDHAGATLAVGSQRNTTRVGFDAIEAALALPHARGRLRPSQVRAAGINEWQPAYVAGIVNALDHDRSS